MNHYEEIKRKKSIDCKNKMIHGKHTKENENTRSDPGESDLMRSASNNNSQNAHGLALFGGR